MVARLGTELQAVIAMPEVRERIQQMGFIPVGSSPEQFNAQFKKDAPVNKGAGGAKSSLWRAKLS